MQFSLCLMVALNHFLTIKFKFQEPTGSLKDYLESSLMSAFSIIIVMYFCDVIDF